MWPLGHLAIAYLLYSGSTRWRFADTPEGTAMVVLFIGALFPDIVDKPLAWYLGMLPSGRSLAHSLVVLIPLCLGLYVVFKHRGQAELAVAFAIGAISHALVDALPAIWREDATANFLLYPLVPIEAYETGPPTILGLLQAQLTSPWFHVEFVLALLALVLWRRDGMPGRGAVRRRIADEETGEVD